MTKDYSLSMVDLIKVATRVAINDRMTQYAGRFHEFLIIRTLVLRLEQGAVLAAMMWILRPSTRPGRCEEPLERNTHLHIDIHLYIFSYIYDMIYIYYIYTLYILYIYTIYTIYIYYIYILYIYYIYTLYIYYTDVYVISIHVCSKYADNPHIWGHCKLLVFKSTISEDLLFCILHIVPNQLNAVESAFAARLEWSAHASYPSTTCI